MQEEYKTILQTSTVEFYEKKSRFIGYASPAETEEEALEFVNSIKQKHKDATHNVYAYMTRKDNITRFTDDGEPSGTAGLPVLDVIRKGGFTDAAIVVTRYFGGTLLGTGGLVKAYGGAASMAISAAKPVVKRLSLIFSITCTYDLLGSVQYSLECDGYTIISTEFTEKVTLTVGVPFDCGEKLTNSIIQVTSSRARIQEIDKEYVNAIYL